MSLPKLIELSRVDFVTIDTIGPPGQRTFYLQAAQDDLLVTLIIEKEQAAAIAVAITGLLERLGQEAQEPEAVDVDLIEPVDPLFRVGKLELGYDQARDLLVIVAEELDVEQGREGTTVHIWASQSQMEQLASRAAIVVASGRPTCPLCGEVIGPDKMHVCVRDNGHKRLYEVDEA
jgi:uncharacterized repeat protein (TIGR03847 family)